MTFQHLNYRAKFAETSFLALYQKLYEAPDPAHFLAAATVTLGHWHSRKIMEHFIPLTILCFPGILIAGC